MRTGTFNPVVLNAKALIGTKGNLSIGIDRVDQLVNPSRTPMLVDTIKFRIDPNIGASADNALALPGIGAAIWCRLDLGRMALTAGRFIPLAVLCSGLDAAAELPCVNNGTGGLYLPPASMVGAFGPVYGTFIWQLPKPLYLPAGEMIVPQFFLDGDIYGGRAGLTVYVTYIGRVLSSDAPVPKYINVPYATAWVDSLRAGGADYQSIKSIRSDLKNAFAEDLYVQKLLGSYSYLSAAANPSTGPFMMGNSAVGPQTGIGNSGVVDLVGNDKVTSRIFKSNGFQVAKDATPWAHLFPWTTRTLDLCGVLKRNEWYQIQSDIKLSSGVPAGDSIKLMASMIGYRKVAYARGSGFVEAA